MRRILFLLLLVLPSIAGAQDVSVRYQSQVIGSRGLPLSNQSVAICSQPAVTSTQPCSPLAVLGTSTSTTTGGANPTTTDALGNFFFYAPPGKYTVQVYGPQVGTQFVQPDTILSCSPTGTCTLTAPLNAKNLNRIRFGDQFASVQAAINDLGNDDAAACTASFVATNCGLVIVPWNNSLANWRPPTSTLGTGTSVLDFSTDPRNPTLWFGNADSSLTLAGTNVGSPGGIAGSPGLLFFNTNKGNTKSRGSQMGYDSGDPLTPRVVWSMDTDNYGAVAPTVGWGDWIWLAFQSAGGSAGQPSQACGGTVQVTNGQTGVIGTGTAFASSMIQGTFTIGTGVTRVNEVITAVADSTHATLSGNWTGSSGAGQSYCIIGGQPGVSKTRAIISQFGVNLFNPTADTLSDYDVQAALTNHNYFVTQTVGADSTNLFRMNSANAGGKVGLELAAGGSNASRKYVALDQATNTLQVLSNAAIGSAVNLFQIDNSGNARLMPVSSKLGIGGQNPSADIDDQSADNTNCWLVHRTGGNIIINCALDGGGNPQLILSNASAVAQTTLSTASLNLFNTGVKIGTGVSTAAPAVGNTGFQHLRVSGCATAASLNATCDTTVTWTAPFANASYTATCTGDVVTSGIPIIQGIDISAAKTGSAITVRTISITAAAAQFTTIDCIAVHD